MTDSTPPTWEIHHADAPILNRMEPHLDTVRIGCRRCGKSFDPTAGDHSLTCEPIG